MKNEKCNVISRRKKTRHLDLRPIAAAAPLLCLCSCGGMLDPQGPVSAAQRVMLLNSLAIMLAIVVPTIALTFVFAWWYRASNEAARYRPEFVYSGRIELVVWSIPTMVVLFLGGIAWVGSHELDPARPIEAQTEPIEVQVVSLDWNWLFIYPAQKIASVNRLFIPGAVPVNFRLTSATVMNAFFVPQLGSMIYTMNGMKTKLNLQSDKVGSTRGMSAHYSGAGFSDMNFEVTTLSGPAFHSWINRTRDTGEALDMNAYARLLKPTSRLQPFTYRTVEDDLFNMIVSNATPTAPGTSADE